MSSYFLKQANTYRIHPKESIDLQEKLPAGNYVLKIDLHGYFLEYVDQFEMPNKLYSDVKKNTDRILKTFFDRPAATGVLLNGEKGSGKTLLAKHISLTAFKSKIPTIIINAPHRGDNFNTFLQQIDQECIIFFDEFEKVYDEDKQEELLTLLDGVYPTKKLFLFTCNNKYRVNEHMKNRPGRIFYLMDFTGLDPVFIREYAQDNLFNKAHIDKLVIMAGSFGNFNFDMLKAIIEEMNRYNESPEDVVRILNTRPEYKVVQDFDVRLYVAGKEIKKERLGAGKTMSCMPLESDFCASIIYDLETPVPSEEYEDEMESDACANFTHEHLTKIDNDGQRFTFEDKENNNRLILTKKVYKAKNYYDFM